MHKYAVDIFIVTDNSPLDSYKLEKSEVDALVICPIEELLKVHKQKNYEFFAYGLNNNGKKIKIKITKDSFPYNWDNYHYKIALLANRFLKGEKDLIY